MKKVLLTGASGYLGGKLCNSLHRQGYSVKVLVRPTSDLSALPASTEIVYGDITDLSSLISAFSDCSVVFHLAALVEPWLPDPSKFISVNVEGLKNVLEAVKQTKTVEKLIYTSSFFAIGPTDGVADESQVHHEKFFCTEYEKSKVATDKIGLQAASEGVPIVLLYPGVIYGPGKVTAGNVVAKMKLQSVASAKSRLGGHDSDKLAVIPNTVQQNQGVTVILSLTAHPKYKSYLVERFSGRLPGYIGKGNDKFSFSHVDDVVEGHIAAMKKGQIGERYLLTGENASFNQVFDMAAVITNTRKPMVSIPLCVIEAYGWLLVFISRITGKLPFISPPTVHVLRHQWEYSCEKAKTELDYKPRSLREGLAEVLLWLKNLGLVKY